jgi:hypothetical protein
VGEWASVGEGASVGNGKFMQFTSVGKKGRTVVLYWHEQQVVVSVGCQTGIPFADFVDRVTHATGTTEDSAQMYRDMMPLFEMARDFVANASRDGAE